MEWDKRKSKSYGNPGNRVGVRERPLCQLKVFKGNCRTFILDADIKDSGNTEGGKNHNLPDVLIQL